jgi:hypothetical protein
VGIGKTNARRVSQQCGESFVALSLVVDCGQRLLKTGIHRVVNGLHEDIEF